MAMKDQHKISIVMATYCGERYVREQLESLAEQSRQADEVLIYDDVSADGTPRIIKDFISEHKPSGWIFRQNAENLGFIRNFHALLEAATGDIIFLCDQDDIWYRDKLERMICVFDAHPEALAVNGGFDFIDGEGKAIPAVTSEGRSNHDLIFRPLEKDTVTSISYLEILKGNITPGCCMAIRRELRDIYLEKTTGLIPHDYELNIFAAEMGGTVFYNRPVIGYRIHGNNQIGMKINDGKSHITTNSNLDKRIKVFRDQEKQMEFFRQRVMTQDREIRTYITHFGEYVKLREQCIIRHNPMAFFGFFLHQKYLRPNISTRIFVGDLIYALRLQRFFEK